MTIESLLDVRVPQPGRESEYGVPDCVVRAANLLYRDRNTASDDAVAVIDAAILRLYEPWARNGCSADRTH